jgi:hypothetical protein
MAARTFDHSRRRAVAGALLAVLLACAACGTPSSSANDDAVTEDGPATAEQLGRPPRIVFTGDSIMRELSGGLAAALDGPAQTSYITMPSVSGNAVGLADWQARMAAPDPPDLVVVLVGTWEGFVVAQSYLEPSWPAPYLDTLDPFLEAVTDGGAEVLWLGYPALALDAEAEQLAAMDQAWATLPERIDGVRYLDAGDAVAPDGVFRLSVSDGQGGTELLRQSDGRHLCPEGVVVMAEPVVSAVEQTFAVEANVAWEEAPWRHDPSGFEHPELCPGEI